MLSSKSHSTVTTSYRTVKIHESLLTWLISLMCWHLVFSRFSEDILNVEYLQWGATTVTVILYAKYVAARGGLSFANFVGSPMGRHAVPEIAFTTVVALFLGIGCWSVLVFFEARVNLHWVYHWWGLISPADFQKLSWMKSWLVVDAITGTVLVPITEEIIFRGFILRRLIARYDTRTAIWVSSFIFALFHVNKSFLGSFFHGVIFAILAVKFASLYVPMAVHGAYNLLVFAAQTCLGAFLVVDPLRVESIRYWLPELACLALGVSLFVIYIQRSSRSFYR